MPDGRAPTSEWAVVSRKTTIAALVWGAVVAAAPASAQQTETVDQALCRMVEKSAAEYRMPVEYFTRLIWQESTFRTDVTSPAGARGVAQFMPGTAAARGLADPFDPEQAIPKAAELLKDLAQRFGNLGLAAAAYNGGPTRTAAWLQGRGTLPSETRSYVLAITGRSAEEWAEDARQSAPPATWVDPPQPVPPQAVPARDAPTFDERAQDAPRQGPAVTCLELVANFRNGVDRRVFVASSGPITESPLAPWGIQIAGDFSKDRALAIYARARQRYAAVLSDVAPMVIGTRLRSRGTGAFYRVRVPAATREAATEFCNRLHKVGGACVVLKS